MTNQCKGFAHNVKTLYKGFAYNVIRRTVTVRNANSLGMFERVGGGKFKPEYVYDDVAVDGCDYLVNASKFAAKHREANRAANVVFFIIDIATCEIIM